MTNQKMGKTKFEKDMDKVMFAYLILPNYIIT